MGGCEAHWEVGRRESRGVVMWGGEWQYGRLESSEVVRREGEGGEIRGSGMRCPVVNGEERGQARVRRVRGWGGDVESARVTKPLLNACQAALPKPPPDAGVVHVGSVVSLNRFAAEAAAAGAAGGEKKLMFHQLFDQLDHLDPKLIRRTDRGESPSCPTNTAISSPLPPLHLPYRSSSLSLPFLPPPPASLPLLPPQLSLSVHPLHSPSPHPPPGLPLPRRL